MRNDLFFETLSAFSDKGDYLEGFGNLVVLEKPNNKFKGGYMGFPQFIVAVDLEILVKLRYHLDQVENLEFKTLESDGYLYDTEYQAKHNINYTTWTSDIVFNWWFAPGSQVSVVWKNAIEDQTNYDDNRHSRTNYNSTTKTTYVHWPTQGHPHRYVIDKVKKITNKFRKQLGMNYDEFKWYLYLKNFPYWAPNVNCYHTLNRFNLKERKMKYGCIDINIKT